MRLLFISQRVNAIEEISEHKKKCACSHAHTHLSIFQITCDYLFDAFSAIVIAFAEAEFNH